MTIFVKINGIRLPAVITGRLSDKDWDGRASKAIKVEMDYQDALVTFVDGVEWFIEEEDERTVEDMNENGELEYKTVLDVVSHDNSEYCIAGDIINHRNGFVTIKMGKPTAEELNSEAVALIDELLIALEV